MTAFRRLAVLVALAATFIGVSVAEAQSLYPLGNIIPIGDSKTWGVTDLPGGCAFRDTMWNAFLSVAGGAWVGSVVGQYPDNGNCPLGGGTLLSEGHSGFHCADIQTQIAGWYSAAGSPPKIILHAGTNDLIAQITAPPNQGWNMDKFYGDFDLMLRSLLGVTPRTTQLFISNMDPMPAILASAPTNLYQVNNYIGQEVKKYQRQGYQIYLINAFSGCGMGAAGDYNAGGIHELPAGYAKIANCYTHTLRTLQP